MAKGATVRMWQRATLALFIIIILGFGLAIGSVFKVAVIDGKELEQKAIDQSLRNTSLTAERGSIYDANGTVLAWSASVWTVVLEPAYIEDDETRIVIAEGLSEILDIDSETILEKTKQQNYYTYLKREVETDIKDKILQFIEENDIERGIILEEDYKRYYPNGTLAASVLGFTGYDNQGLAGLEAEYDSELSGTEGLLLSARNAVGTDMAFEYEQNIEAEDGYDLTLTLDATVQGIVERCLKEGVEKNLVANGATAIVMDVETFGIVAMAVEGTYDPNDPLTLYDKDLEAEIDKIVDEDERDTAYNNALQAQWRNKAVNDTYYPGSVFKMVTAAIAMEEGLVTENTTYYCSGAFHFDDGTADQHCWATLGHDLQTFVEGLCNSCNPFFIDIGQKIGKETFVKYVDAFGFRAPTGIDLPGESQGIFFSQIGTAELATLSYGQNFGITPLQMISACAAIVNGGYLGTPHVVGQITDSDGNILEKVDANIKRQVISEDTSKRICAILQENATVGTAKNGYVAGYRIGGKTGTSEKVVEDNLSGGDEKHYVASYCGFAPADDPQYAVLVIFDEPKGDSYYGGAVAGPVFSTIMEEILPYLNVDRRLTVEEYEQLGGTAPDVVGMDIETAKSEVFDSGYIYKIVGNGTTVVEQVPYAGSTVPLDGTVVLYTDEESKNQKAIVPNFAGMTLYEANNAAAEAGVQIMAGGAAANGSNVIAALQDCEAGTSVNMGTVIYITFAEHDTVG